MYICMYNRYMYKYISIYVTNIFGGFHGHGSTKWMTGGSPT